MTFKVRKKDTNIKSKESKPPVLKHGLKVTTSQIFFPLEACLPRTRVLQRPRSKATRTSQ